jgi:hypothetical protein
MPTHYTCPKQEQWDNLPILRYFLTIPFLMRRRMISIRPTCRRIKTENSKESLVERLLSLENVLSSKTAVSRARTFEFLHSPDPAYRISAYRSLCINPLPAAAPIILQEALNPASPLRREALSTLGFINDSTQIPTLRPLLQTAPPRVAASAFKTLMRMGERLTDTEVLAYWQAWEDPSDRSEILIGLSATGQVPLLWAVLRAELAAGHSGDFLNIVMLYLAAALGERSEICEIWNTESKSPGSGEAFVLGELNDQPAWSDLASPGSDRAAWRARIATRLNCTNIPDDRTAISLLFLASKTP